ncbi:MAG: hypothetical protein K2Q18_16905 [Bdellovibrionales bacterium]|nr:hypothetical protein [Bdellovibrionales bacterium]
MPLDDLQKIFPEAKKFSLLEGTLFSEQVKSIESKLNEKLSDADTVPTFYFAVKNQNEKFIRIGVAVFSTPKSNTDKLIVGVGVDLTGKITNVVLLKSKYSDRLSDNKFLSQFKGKNLESPLQIKKDIEPASSDLTIESGLVAEAVKKSLLTIAAVFNKDKNDIQTK